MEKGIIFRISRPYKVYRTAMAPKIVVPGVKGDLTVLVDRAPTLVQLRNGLVQVLDKADKVTERYFIKGGIADIAATAAPFRPKRLLLTKIRTSKKPRPNATPPSMMKTRLIIR